MKQSTRYTLLSSIMSLTHVAAGNTPSEQSGVPETARPYNVLFIAVDDLNDWVGAFGGNPQAKTPHFDRFAERYGMVMLSAYAPAPVCGPSRTALLTGRFPSNTGVYQNWQNMKDAPHARDLETLPEYFGRHGWSTLGAGKIFHRHRTAGGGRDDGQWAFHEFVRPGGNFDAEEEWVFISGGMRWGITRTPVERTADYVAAKWAADQLLDRDFGDQPFFLALGIFRPHLPWIVPQEFYDLYPLEDVVPAPFRRDDLDDIVDPDGNPVFGPTHWFERIDELDLHREANRAYLASMSYADRCLGVVFDALERSGRLRDTIVMIWGDHGWHLGEKLHYGKITLWEESARVPFVVYVPGLTEGGQRTEGVVNLIDMYPTLLELCGLPPNPKNDGRSFVPLLQDPERTWNEPTLTTYHFMNHSVTDGQYRYTWYGGRGEAEELYDMHADPYCYTNLIRRAEYRPVVERLRPYIPTVNIPDAPISQYNVEARRERNRQRALQRRLAEEEEDDRYE